MPFPTGTDFDRFQAEIEWVLRTLEDRRRYPLLSERVLPNLQRDLDGGLARWVTRGRGYMIPPMILSIQRWRAQGTVPEALLDRLEAGLRFNQGNRAELGNLTGNFWDPQLAASIIMQLMVTASLIRRAQAGALAPVAANRPDLWVTLDGRRIGLEITSRNVLRDLTLEPGDSVDWQEAREDFQVLWNGPFVAKQADYDGSYPIVLVVWDCEIMDDVHSFVTEPRLDGVQRSFGDLIAMHRPNCTPFSAIVYLPYVAAPHVVPCDGLSRGMLLTQAEIAGLRRLFDVNPATENGFMPPGAMV